MTQTLPPTTGESDETSDFGLDRVAAVDDREQADHSLTTRRPVPLR